MNSLLDVMACLGALLVIYVVVVFLLGTFIKSDNDIAMNITSALVALACIAALVYRVVV